MGIILDTSVIIAAERKGNTVRQILEQIRTSQGEVAVALSVVTIAELIHGAYRAKTREQQDRRIQFVERIAADIPVYTVTIEIASMAGRIDGQQEARGVQIAFEDLLIAVTALHHGHRVVTLNMRDFERIPGLVVGKV